MSLLRPETLVNQEKNIGLVEPVELTNTKVIQSRENQECIKDTSDLETLSSTLENGNIEADSSSDYSDTTDEEPLHNEESDPLTINQATRPTLDIDSGGNTNDNQSFNPTYLSMAKNAIKSLLLRKTAQKKMKNKKRCWEGKKAQIKTGPQNWKKGGLQKKKKNFARLEGLFISLCIRSFV